MNLFVRLFALFAIVPLIELYLLMEIGQTIGTGLTIAIIILTGVVGAYLAKNQGISKVLEIQNKLGVGELPGMEILEGVLILISGITLMTPGFFTDSIGLTLLFPYTRKKILAFLFSQMKDRFADGKYKFRVDAMHAKGSWETSEDVIDVDKNTR